MSLVLAVINLWLVAANPSASSQSRVVSLPQGEVTRIQSPDGKWTLVFGCPNACSQRNLWIEDSSLRMRRLVKEYDRSLSVSWAPDSRHFFVNDAWGSQPRILRIGTTCDKCAAIGSVCFAGRSATNCGGQPQRYAGTTEVRRQ